MSYNRLMAVCISRVTTAVHVQLNLKKRVGTNVAWTVEKVVAVTVTSVEIATLGESHSSNL